MKNPTSISHFPGPQQQALLRLKNQIVKLYKPLIIYFVDGENHHQTSWNCFSKPRNRTEWHFSCDLLLVLPQGVTQLEPEIKASKFEGMDDNITVNLRIHPNDFVQAQLQEFSLYFCWVQRRAIVLYENNNACQNLPTPVRNLKRFLTWLRRNNKGKPSPNFYHNVQKGNNFCFCKMEPVVFN